MDRIGINMISSYCLLVLKVKVCACTECLWLQFIARGQLEMQKNYICFGMEEEEEILLLVVVFLG